MVKVRERKLGRHKAVGLAYFEDKLIEIDPRQPPREWLSTAIHEGLHLARPDLPEDEILRIERILFQTLWGANVRRIHQ